MFPAATVFFLDTLLGLEFEEARKAGLPECSDEYRWTSGGRWPSPTSSAGPGVPSPSCVASIVPVKNTLNVFREHLDAVCSHVLLNELLRQYGLRRTVENPLRFLLTRLRGVSSNRWSSPILRERMRFEMPRELDRGRPSPLHCSEPPTRCRRAKPRCGWVGELLRRWSWVEARLAGDGTPWWWRIGSRRQASGRSSARQHGLSVVVEVVSVQGWVAKGAEEGDEGNLGNTENT
ncbi:hypothetical protein EJB05_48721 [Eragrostis curvula]|uniref:Uncharacterized protein n=1 Tax=Eragrostis curvula TaxID=38414 RepID=A0A5J9T2J3_9POAL|nr:hypothetical protein EJB05_48721 [Eragrostis curvula]